MALDAAQLADASRALCPHRDHQGALRRFHHDHPQPQRRLPTRDEESIVTRALALLDKTEAGTRPVRLLGVSVHNLCTELVDVQDPQARLPFE